MKFVKYVTLSAASAELLDKLVNEHLALGFEPFGSPYLKYGAANDGTTASFFHQAVVMDKETFQKLTEKPPARNPMMRQY